MVQNLCICLSLAFFITLNLDKVASIIYRSPRFIVHQAKSLVKNQMWLALNIMTLFKFNEIISHAVRFNRIINIYKNLYISYLAMNIIIQLLHVICIILCQHLPIGILIDKIKFQIKKIMPAGNRQQYINRAASYQQVKHGQN